MRLEPYAVSLARICHHGKRHLNLGLGGGLRRDRAHLRDIEVARIERVVIRSCHFHRGQTGRLVEPGAFDPKWAGKVASIEGTKGIKQGRVCSVTLYRFETRSCRIDTRSGSIVRGSRTGGAIALRAAAYWLVLGRSGGGGFT